MLTACLLKNKQKKKKKRKKLNLAVPPVQKTSTWRKIIFQKRKNQTVNRNRFPFILSKGNIALFAICFTKTDEFKVYYNVQLFPVLFYKFCIMLKLKHLKVTVQLLCWTVRYNIWWLSDRNRKQGVENPLVFSRGHGGGFCYYAQRWGELLQSRFLFVRGQFTTW